MEVFRAALDHLDEATTIGGGEPTIHPYFEKILLACIGKCHEWGECGPHIVTNGKKTQLALMIATLTKGGVISGELSQDIYHDPIDEKVIEAFEKATPKEYHTNGGHRGAIRDTTNRGQREPLPHGRGLDIWGYDEENPPKRDGSECLCDTYMIKPNGDIHQCGCADSPIIGNVFEGYDSPSSECCHSSEFANACLDGGYEHLLE
jgi:MoaA/NifB/PqqE/SkfB family radical SAM enzyme